MALWHVEYEDGDDADLELHEVEAHFAAHKAACEAALVAEAAAARAAPPMAPPTAPPTVSTTAPPTAPPRELIRPKPKRRRVDEEGVGSGYGVEWIVKGHPYLGKAVRRMHGRTECEGVIAKCALEGSHPFGVGVLFHATFEVGPKNATGETLSEKEAEDGIKLQQSVAKQERFRARSEVPRVVLDGGERAARVSTRARVSMSQ